QYDLDNLGEYINNKVQKSLEPLDNLGARISSDVQRQLAPLHNLGARINSDVQRQTAHLNGLGSRINSDLELQLAPLENLGTTIQEQVEKGLEPVRILESIIKVKFGTDGTTIATFNPGARRFIIRDGVVYECGGSISESDGSCSSDLQRLQFDKNEDFCYSTSKSIINGWYCIASTGSTTMSYINGKITCKGSNGTPSLLIKGDDYNELCKNVATSANYKYFTTRSLQHIGDGLRCSGNNPQICTYSETLRNRNNIVNSSGGTIIFSSFNK
ncbi:uncharacterized protein BDFB_013501, partial [Asbolus verrucosus]